MEENNEKGEKIRRCPVCGCTEHRLVGCNRHWGKHRKGPDGRCVEAAT